LVKSELRNVGAEVREQLCEESVQSSSQSRTGENAN
jgi:hypothetical protein